MQYCTLIGEYTSYSLIQFNTETLRQSVLEVVVKLNPSPAGEGRSVRELYPSPAGMIHHGVVSKSSRNDLSWTLDHIGDVIETPVRRVKREPSWRLLLHVRQVKTSSAIYRERVDTSRQ